ncbi:MAG: GAF domain-containing protein [Armatimonadetes bacterium]|nr:GAF domain-containing protein [Armatimonadota bacterium]
MAPLASEPDGSLSTPAIVRGLNDITRLLAGEEESDCRLRAAFASARELVSCDHGIILWWPEGELLPLCEMGCPYGSSASIRPRLERHARIIAGESIARAEELHLRQEGMEAILPAGPETAWLSLPLMGPEGILGLIHLARDESRRFTDTQIGLLSLVASQIAACVVTARLQESLSHTYTAQVRFLDVVSHGLRNLLTPILANVQAMALQIGPDERLQRMLGRAEASVRQMVRWVDDLLDAQRILRGVVELRPRVVDLCLIAESVVESRRPAGAEKDLALQLERCSAPVWVMGDRLRLEQVVATLVSNGIRHTETGEVRVAVDREEKHAVLRVSDTGIGMDARAQANAFELFRAEDVGGQRCAGLGTELAVVKRLVELHGGRVCCHSAGPGRGSTFIVELPLAPPANREQL